jgi:hypothetical protein
VAGYKVRLLIGALLTASVTPWAQTNGARKQPEVHLRTLHLSVSDELPVKSFPGITIASPVLCSPEGNILVRPATIEAVLDPVAISPDGHITARFGRENITQVQHSEPLYAFMRDKDVFLLVSGTTQLDHQDELHTPDGRILHQQAIEHTTRLAHFHADGGFAGSFELDLPFRIAQFGEFETGDFLITGTDKRTGEPRAAIVNSTGQMLRTIGIEGLPGEGSSEKAEITRNGSDRENGVESDHTGSAPPFSAPFFTLQVIADGPDLLIFSPGRNAVLFVTAGGAVRTMRLQVPTGFELETVQPAKGQLIVELTKDRRDGTGGDFAAFAVDRTSGIPTVEFVYSRDLGFGMACTDGVQFTFLTLDPESKGIKLVKLVPTNDPLALPEPKFQ